MGDGLGIQDLLKSVKRGIEFARLDNGPWYNAELSLVQSGNEI